LLRVIPKDRKIFKSSDGDVAVLFPAATSQKKPTPSSTATSNTDDVETDAEDEHVCHMKLCCSQLMFFTESFFLYLIFSPSMIGLNI